MTSEIKWIGITLNDIISKDLKKQQINQLITTLDELENAVNQRKNNIVNRLTNYPIIGIHKNEYNKNDFSAGVTANEMLVIDSPTLTNSRSSADSSETNIDISEELLEDSGMLSIED